MKTDKFIMIGGVSFAVLLIAIGLYRDHLHPPVCTEEHTVVDIVSVDYRWSTFVDENGKQQKVYGGTYEKGQKYCIAYDR